jgi:hypothetical protein
VGQFDFPSAAALARLKSDELSEPPVGAVATALVSIGSKILELSGFHGAAPLTNLIQELKGLAARKDETNLIYFGEQLVIDIGSLYRMGEDMRRRVEELLESAEFNEAVANATLHITRTNIETRLTRVARLIVNGVRFSDLKPEPLDDMMRSAVDLTDADILLLGKIYDSQAPLLRQGSLNTTNWFGQVQSYWDEFVNSGALDPSKHLVYRSSLSRLESRGLIQKFREISTAAVGLEHYALLEEGLKFFERVQEIGKDLDPART